MTKKSDTDPGTPSALAERQLANLKRKFAQRVDAATKKITKWQEDLAGNPAYAMEWSHTAFTAAAEHKVFSVILNTVNSRTEKGEDYAEIVKGITESCQREVNLRARNSRSTSATANIMEREPAGDLGRRFGGHRLGAMKIFQSNWR